MWRLGFSPRGCRETRACPGAQAGVKALLSSEAFVGGWHIARSLGLEAWASLKSFRPKGAARASLPTRGRNGERNLHGEWRRNDSHGSTSDPEARLFRKGPGREVRLCFSEPRADRQDKAVTPHVAQNTSGRRSAIDDRITHHHGYAISQRIRKRVEEAFGWAKTVAGLRKMRHRGLLKVDWQFTLAMASETRAPRKSARF